MHLHAPRTHETTGTLHAAGMAGTFHEWQDGQKQRRDERLGFRTQRELRVGDTLWIQNASGQIRQIHGVVARREVTDDFIDSEAFVKHPEAATFLERATLPDGRVVYKVAIAPSGGEAFVVAFDASTWLVDQKSYMEHDSAEVVTYNDYHVVNGLLVPYTEIDSTGDAQFDVISKVTSVTVDQPIAPETFAPLIPAIVDISSPVRIPLSIENGLPFVNVTIAGHSYHFLVDSGSQGNVIDPRVAKELGLHPDGPLEVRGAERVSSLGVVETPVMHLGPVALPSRIATVLDLGSILPGSIQLDGVLGYPLFASAELRFDADARELLVGKPGTLPALGTKLDVDTDRELAEVDATIDGTAKTKLLVDTGNSNELLLYESFLERHKGVVDYIASHYVLNHGAGGSLAAKGTFVDSLQLGDQRMYNRYANVILSSRGAFADRNDGGNVGYGTLHNFVATFDLANNALFLARGRNFDDGRYRARTEPNARVWPPEPFSPGPP